MMTSLEKLACGFTVIAVLFISFVLPRFYSNSRAKETFQYYKEDFEIIKDYLIQTSEMYGKDTRTIYYLKFNEQREITGLSDYPIELGCFEIAALNRLSGIFTQSFDYIEINGKRISFGGCGTTMIVFSGDGKRPQYFYYPIIGCPKVPFRTEKLSDEWFYLILTVR